MKNLNIIKTIIENTRKKDTDKVTEAYKKLLDVTPMERYYLFKGFKEASCELMWESRKYSSGYSNKVASIILKEIHNAKEGESVMDSPDWAPAYNGMGNLDAYTTEIKKIVEGK